MPFDAEILPIVHAKPVTPADTLDRAADILERPGGWIQCCVARDANGRAVWFNAPEAVSFCSGGVMAHLNAIGSKAHHALRAAVPGDLVDWNNDPARTQAEVVAVFRQAAANMRAAERVA